MRNRLNFYLLSLIASLCFALLVLSGCSTVSSHGTPAEGRGGATPDRSLKTQQVSQTELELSRLQSLKPTLSPADVLDRFVMFLIQRSL